MLNLTEYLFTICRAGQRIPKSVSQQTHRFWRHVATLSVFWRLSSHSRHVFPKKKLADRLHGPPVTTQFQQDAKPKAKRVLVG